MKNVSQKTAREKSLLEEACKIVLFNFGEHAAKLYEAGLKDKAEKEILTSLENSLKELLGPEQAEQQLEGIRKKFNKNLK